MTERAKTLISFDIRSLACDDCASEIKLKASAFPIALQIFIPDNHPVRVIVPDGPHAKTRFDDYIDELQVKAKLWDTEDRA